MITSELIERINYLSRKQRSEGLTLEEQTEQAALRQTYIEGIKSQVRSSLETTKKTPKHHHHDSHDSCTCSTGCKCHMKD